MALGLGLLVAECVALKGLTVFVIVAKLPLGVVVRPESVLVLLTVSREIVVLADSVSETVETVPLADLDRLLDILIDEPERLLFDGVFVWSLGLNDAKEYVD